MDMKSVKRLTSPFWEEKVNACFQQEKLQLARQKHEVVTLVVKKF